MSLKNAMDMSAHTSVATPFGYMRAGELASEPAARLPGRSAVGTPRGRRGHGVRVRALIEYWSIRSAFVEPQSDATRGPTRVSLLSAASAAGTNATRGK